MNFKLHRSQLTRPNKVTTFNITAFGANQNLPDNTDAVQAAMNAAKLSDTVYVPLGTFHMDATRSVRPKSGTKIKIDGSLAANPNNQVQSSVILLQGVSNVTVIGPGQIIGERATHQAPGPARAGGVLHVMDSTNITVAGGLIMRDAWGDGLYVQDCKFVIVDGVNCQNNSRNGLSIIAVETMRVTNSIFTLTNSASPMPQAGIDIEPDLPTQAILDLTITQNRFIKNKGAGCYIAFVQQPNRARVYVVNNTFDQHYRDGSGPPLGGINTFLGNFLYATCRWIPGYDWWAYKSEYTLS